VDPAPDSVDADLIARRVVEVLREVEGPMNRGLLKTEEAAQLLGVDAEWVRANRVALGAVKLGDGPKARLRFPREAIDAYLAPRKVGASLPSEGLSVSTPKTSRRRRGSTPSLPATGQAVIDW
jgi:hypothetical protein